MPQQIDPNEREILLTIDDVAHVLQVSSQSVMRMIKRHEIKGLKVAHQWRVRPVDLSTYLQAQEQQGGKSE